MKNKPKSEARTQLFGWILFILCAIFFLASGINNQDALTIIGSVIFLIACIVFIIPLVAAKPLPPKDKDTRDPS